MELNIKYYDHKYYKFRYYIFIACIPLLIILFFSFSKNNGDSYYSLALEEYSSRNYSVVIDRCQQAIEKGVKKTPLDMVFKLQGVSYLALDLYEDAIKCFEESLALNNENYQVWTILGVAYRQNGDYQKALECYEKSISIEPNYAETQSSLGSLYILKGDPENAMTYFEKAIELDPSLAVAYGNMALALAMTGKFDEAERALKQAISLGYEGADTIRERIEELKQYDVNYP